MRNGSAGDRFTDLGGSGGFASGAGASLVTDAALGAGLALRVPAVVLTTSGTAAANLHPAVCEADEAAVPLIVLTADRPPELRGIGAGQTIDQLKLYGSAVRWFCEVGTQEADDSGLLQLRSVACRAVAGARGEPRPGPVHLNFALREPLAPVAVPGAVTATNPLALVGRQSVDGLDDAAAGDGRSLTTVIPNMLAPGAQLVEAIVERVEACERPIIVAGRQSDPGLGAALAALAAAIDAPILADATSQLRFGRHDRSRVVWAYEPVSRLRPPALEPDLVLRFGDLPTCKPLRSWLAEMPDAVQLAVDPSFGWCDPTRVAGALIRCDPSALATAVAERCGEQPTGQAGTPRASTLGWLAAGTASAEAIATRLSGSAEPTEPGLWPLLAGHLADGDQVLAASSMPIRDQEAFLPTGDEVVRFLANRGANGIDGLVATAAGAATAAAAPTWLVIGDLALQHDANGLAAIRDGAPVRIIVVDNGGGGIFHFLPQAELLEEAEFEGLLGTPLAVPPEKLAAAYGLSWETPATTAELSAALAGDAQMVVLRTDRDANHKLHLELTDLATAAVGKALPA